LVQVPAPAQVFLRPQGTARRLTRNATSGQNIQPPPGIPGASSPAAISGPTFFPASANSPAAQRSQPTALELTQLNTAYRAAQSGGRGHYNGYILLLTQALQVYPHLSASDLNVLHQGQNNGSA
jgi:hypothetical protein